MAKVPAYHTTKDPGNPVYHTYNDCPAGSRVIADGNAVSDTGGFRLCDFCNKNDKTGEF